MTNTAEILRSNGLYFGNVAHLETATESLSILERRMVDAALLGMLAARTSNKTWEELVARAVKQVKP